jgi:hypothetical protein
MILNCVIDNTLTLKRVFKSCLSVINNTNENV